jgi:putative glutamine amidotransferase
LQVLNVARGGTLHQHLPDVVDGRINHRQHEPGRRSTHWVTLGGSGHLSRILPGRRAKVNSFHHQAVDALGADLAISARASDGTVEAVEALDREFVVGVQWHAELLVERPDQAGLFRAFVDAAAAFECNRARFARAA